MRYDESGEYDNEDAWFFGSVVLALYLIGTAIWVFGWVVVFGVAASVLALTVGIALYMQSETRRYLQARREIRRLTASTKRRMRKLRR